MRLAISNLAWPSAQDDIVFDRLARLGVSGVEVAPTRLAAWDALPKNLQQIVENEFNTAIIQASAQQLQSELTVESTLRSEGLVFNRPDVEPFRQIIRNSGLYAQWRDTFAPQGWAILEKSAGKLIQ